MTLLIIAVVTKLSLCKTPKRFYLKNSNFCETLILPTTQKLDDHRFIALMTNNNVAPFISVREAGLLSFWLIYRHRGVVHSGNFCSPEPVSSWMISLITSGNATAVNALLLFPTQFACLCSRHMCLLFMGGCVCPFGWTRVHLEKLKDLQSWRTGMLM